MSIRVAVDAMGGDHAPDVVVQGAVNALGRSDDIDVVLFGPGHEIEPLIEKLGRRVEASLFHFEAPDVISMSDTASVALKTKTKSSIHLGLGACKAGKAGAFVSAGNTGAIMAASLFILGRLPGVSRPSVIGFYPTVKGLCILLDAGTNVDCKPEHLVQFAKMGSVYVERVLHKENPTVGLMNIGEEPGKGNELVKATYGKLEKAAHLNFVGNIEGRDLLNHAADVVLTDGFVGNILLKFGESISSVLPKMIGAEMNRLRMPGDEQAIVEKALKGVKARFDYAEYGGGPLLGVDGSVIIGHGGSNALAIENMILNAAEMVREDVSSSISAALSE
ncbi:MAG: phosphate acyltransferase PlsX [Bacteroidetes bacterium]|nr:phosphate acyltransferase PlsX [Bacteroidota bacterium]